jgi:hypothetical protein
MAADSVSNTGIMERTALPYRGQLDTIQFQTWSRIIRLITLAMICLAALCGGALAHPPADAAVTYDENTGDLGVTITHPVDDPSKHYVKQVIVRQGDTILVNKSYISQPDRLLFTYRYNLPQLKGISAEIRVDVLCNLFGSRTGTLILRPTYPAAAPGSATPAATAPAKSPAGACTALVAAGLVATRILRGY